MKRISATEAARNFSDILDQVARQGESFVVLRHQEAVGQLVPVPRSITLRELLELELPPVDEQFEADVQEIQDKQTALPASPWPT